MVDTTLSAKDTALDILAGYQILGAIAGGVIWIILLLQNFAMLNFAWVIVIVIALLLYFYSFLSGYVLLKDRAMGLQMSLINQLLQVLGFTLGGISFQYSSGLGFNLELGFSNNVVRLGFNLLIANTRLLWGTVDAFIKQVDLNLIAIFLAIYIYRRIRKERLRSMAGTIDSIGESAESTTNY